MEKREFIDRNELNFITVTTDDYNGNESLSVVLKEEIDEISTISENEIVKPYLEKLKKQIHAKNFERGLMNPILTYADIMHIIDKLLLEEE